MPVKAMEARCPEHTARLSLKSYPTSGYSVEERNPMSEKKICISARRAIIIAAEHARIKPKELGSLSLVREEDAYCISFCDTGRSYSCEIDVTTGEVILFSDEPA